MSHHHSFSAFYAIFAYSVHKKIIQGAAEKN